MKQNLKVYQIYYKDDQKEQFFLDTIPYYNQDLSLYFENDIILSLYHRGMVTGDYFGVLSWKIRQKDRIKQKRLKKLIDYRFDIYSFTYDRHDVLGYADICHPGYLDIFHELLKYLGINEEIRPAVGLYQNAVITRPEIYVDYIENFLLPTILFFNNCSERIKELLFTDARYRGVGVDKLEETLGVGHYTYHTFVLERLWSLYYEVRRKKDKLSYRFDKFLSNRASSVKVDTKGKIHKINL